MDGRTQQTSSAKNPNLSYQERLANYERDKLSIPRIAGDTKTYEATLKALAKKWRI